MSFIISFASSSGKFNFENRVKRSTGVCVFFYNTGIPFWEFMNYFFD